MITLQGQIDFIQNEKKQNEFQSNIFGNFYKMLGLEIGAIYALKDLSLRHLPESWPPSSSFSSKPLQ